MTLKKLLGMLAIPYLIFTPVRAILVSVQLYSMLNSPLVPWQARWGIMEKFVIVAILGLILSTLGIYQFVKERYFLVFIFGLMLMLGEYLAYELVP